MKSKSFKKSIKRHLFEGLELSVLILALLALGKMFLKRPKEIKNLATKTKNQSQANFDDSVVVVFSKLTDKAIDSETKLAVDSGEIPGVILSTATLLTSYKGTGFFISNDGYILTAGHLLLNLTPHRYFDSSINDVTEYVKDNSEVEIAVKNMPGKQLPVKIIAINATYDLAVLKLEGAKGMKYLKFASDSSVYPGESVMDVGNPLDFSWLYKPNYIAAKEIYSFLVPPEILEIIIPEYVYVLASPEDEGMSGAPVIDKNGNVVCLIEQFESDTNEAPIDVCTPGSVIHTYLTAIGVLNK